MRKKAREKRWWERGMRGREVRGERVEKREGRNAKMKHEKVIK